ncbi:MAG: acyltransferase [Clostridia bacterium]|nr:acyltransferase [Clostridia bacterium]
MQDLITKGAVEKRERNYGIDLLRIVSMFFICVHHTLIHGGLLSAAPQSVNYYCAWLIDAAVICAVNCYALISGFVGADSKFKVSNIVYLWLQVVFYSVIIAAVFMVVQPETYGLATLIQSFFPVTVSLSYWYFKAYFGMFFLIPIMNFVITNMPRRALKWTLVLFLTAVITVSLFADDVFGLRGGYIVWWLAILYLVGGYVKKYDPLKNAKTGWLIFTAIVSVLISWAYKLVAEKIGLNAYSDRLLSYVSPTVFAVALILLTVFSGIKFDRKPRLIAFFAPLSFGVYLIHDNIAVRNALISGRFVSFAEQSFALMILCVLGMAFGIYVVCSLIDYLRLMLFKAFKLKSLLSKAEEKVKNRILEREVPKE